MNARGAARRLLVGLAVVAFVAGCASGASPTPIPASLGPNAGAAPTPTISATETPAAVPAMSPSALPAAVSYGPVTVVTGTSDCGDLSPHWTRAPDGTYHARNQTITCNDTSNDPRVSGAHTASFSMDVWGELSPPEAAGVQWGTVRIENAGGAWEGRFTGVASLPQPGDTIAEWFTGTGGYAGLSYFALITGVCCVYQIHGQIYPGDPPKP
jgi:hypothetical protein